MRVILFIAVLPIAFAGLLGAAEPRPDTYWSEYHKAMREPLLQSAKIADSDYQFRWTRLDGSHDPMAIRVWQHQGKTRCRSVRLEYRLDFSRGPIKIDKTIRLSDEQTAQLRGFISSDSFWAPLNGKERAVQDQLLGGAHWLLEMKDSSGYRVVSLFSPVLVASNPKLSASLRNPHHYIDAATFLLKATKLFPDETEAAY